MNIYLFETSSRVLLEEQIAKILKDSNNKVIYNAETTNIEDILEEASYVSMFDEMKYVIVKNSSFFGTGKLKEKEEQLLLNYLENPYPLCTLIFTTYEAVDNRKKITKLLKEKFCYQKIETPKGLELYNKVASLLIEKKYLAEKDTINYLINACLNNYDLICNEIDKIDLYYQKPTKINLENIKHIISRTMTDNNFKFIDIVINKDLKKAFPYLEELITLKVEPLTLINLLAREYRNMLLLKKLNDEHYSKKDILSLLQLQEWQYDKTSKNAANYHIDDLKDYLVNLEKLDYQIKSGQIDKVIGLKMFLLDLYEY